MRRYLLGRLLRTLPVVFGVVTVVFLLIHLLPGDPVEIMLGESAVPAQFLASPEFGTPVPRP
jgi:peptide/nickel transport system permease protein